MKRLAVREFQVRCLQVISDLQKDRIPVIITNEGRAVAKLVATKRVALSVFGCMGQTARIVGDIEAPIW